MPVRGTKAYQCSMQKARDGWKILHAPSFWHYLGSGCQELSMDVSMICSQAAGPLEFSGWTPWYKFQNGLLTL